jgi:superfamily I DNA and/or RNA helicase
MNSAPVSFVDTAGADWNEEIDPEGESKFNAQEARWVIAQIRDLLDAGIKQEDIAVIAPYSAQVRYIRDRCDFSAVEIDTVDGFQGREKEVVIISLVRSNTIGEVGFLADKRRMNVAMTRAKRKLIAIGDSSTLAQNPFFEEWIDDCQAKGFYQSIWEFGPNDADE